MKSNFKLTEGSSLILDLIRGLSAQVVVIGHGISFFGIFTFLHEPNFPWMQNIAVLIFFLLSGFLITYSTVRKLDKENYNFKYYFADRLSRIYTAFIPAIIFVLIIDSLCLYLKPNDYVYSEAFNIKTLIGNLFMLQDYPFSYKLSTNFSITSFGSGRPFWTLAIEWWIYLFFGYLLLVIFKKRKLKLLNILVLLVFSIVPVYNLISGRGNGLTTYWIFGAIIYLIISLKILEKITYRLKVIMASGLLILAFVRAYFVMSAYDAIFAFLLSITLLLIIDLFKNIKFKKLFQKFIKFNASYSYTLYLIHYSILDFIFVNYSNYYNKYILFIIGFLVSNIISAVIGRYVEISLTYKVKQYLYKFIKNKSLIKR